jgi:hypothetical protein
VAIRRRDIFIHILNNDSLLNVFHHCRPAPLDESKSDTLHTFDGGKWEGERWWYKLVKVCGRWRSLILGSPSHLHLGILCTYGKPVADMLAHAPFFRVPLIIDYPDYHHITGEDKDIRLALQNRDRVRRIRVRMRFQDLATLIMAIDKKFPILEYLEIATPITYGINLILPKTFQAPQLRYLMLSGTALPRGSALPTSLAGLVLLALCWTYPSTYLHPGDLLQRLSFAPQLEELQISFNSAVPNTEHRPISRAPSMTHVTFLSLRTFAFKGPSAFLEALLPCMTTPLLKNIQLIFFYHPPFSVPHLLQFLSTIEGLRFACAKLTFNDELISVMAHPHEADVGHFSCLYLDCGAFNRQLASAEQIFNSLGTIFTTVENLTLEFARGDLPFDTSTEVEPVTRTGAWREILQSFRDVRTLLVDDKTTGEVSRSLVLDDGGSPMDRLPDLKELSYFACDDVGGAFTAFSDARQKSGRPAILIRPWVR